MRRTFFIALLTICSTFLSYSQDTDFILQSIAMRDFLLMQDKINEQEHIFTIDTTETDTFQCTVRVVGNYIEIESNVYITSMKLENIAGQIIYKSSSDKIQIKSCTLGPLTIGVYILYIYCKDQAYIKRVIIK